MKDKISAFCLFLLILFSVSCKKESSTSIVGDWMSVSVYTIQDNGAYSWISIDGHHEYYNFSAEGRFGSSTDVPGPIGKYSYDSELQNLILNYEADRYGNMPGREILKVELLTRNKMILSYFSSASNFIYKTEYSRIN